MYNILWKGNHSCTAYQILDRREKNVHQGIVGFNYLPWWCSWCNLTQKCLLFQPSGYASYSGGGMKETCLYINFNIFVLNFCICWCPVSSRPAICCSRRIQEQHRWWWRNRGSEKWTFCWQGPFEWQVRQGTIHLQNLPSGKVRDAVLIFFEGSLYPPTLYNSKVPAYIRLLAPKGSLEIHEEAWNAYPYCRTVITVSTQSFFITGLISLMVLNGVVVSCPIYPFQNPGYMKENFYIVIETMHYGDTGITENVSWTKIYRRFWDLYAHKKEDFWRPLWIYLSPKIHELPPEKLKMREVVMIDIANDPIQPADYKPHEDPTKFQSVKTNRGPLIGKWQDTVRKRNNCRKVATLVHFIGFLNGLGEYRLVSVI